jgi:2-polyprenyl-3-methyl-5-hydroxy-6-metoxy-1,4-benzoquinol methylase
MMQSHLGQCGVESGASYLDVGACYGWFVAQMRADGFDAHGVELDPRAPELAAAVYDIEPERITTSEASTFLAALEGTYDVVSCFSVLHHFVLGRGPCSAEELIELLDRATGRVLFFDTGEAHESWFAEVLPEWNAEYIEKWLRANTSFTNVVRLGVDEDARGPYAENYGRTLFACMR